MLKHQTSFKIPLRIFQKPQFSTKFLKHQISIRARFRIIYGKILIRGELTDRQQDLIYLHYLAKREIEANVLNFSVMLHVL